MSKHVCPWWMGYLLASPLRSLLMQGPAQILADYLQPGMTVLEPGPGMGFFTLPMARMVGPLGRIVALDIQPQMLDGLRRRAKSKGLLDRIDTRIVPPDSLGVDDLSGSVDFVLAFAVVHEMPSAQAFFASAAAALRPGGQLYFAEPSGHVEPAHFQAELDAAHAAGLETVSLPQLRRSHAAVLRKP